MTFKEFYIEGKKVKELFIDGKQVKFADDDILHQIANSVVGGEAYYVEGDEQWVRFTATSKQEFIQLSEFYLYDEFGNRINLNLTPQESLADKNTCWANFPSWSTQSVQYLFDNNADTKWGIAEKSSVVTMHLGNGHKIASYNLRSGNDTAVYPERAVVSWKLEWSSDRTNWITLDEKTSSDTAGDPALVNNKRLYNNGNPYRISPTYSRSGDLVVKFSDTTTIGSLTIPNCEGIESLTTKALIVAGGGSGGSSYLTNNRAGGGGAGGLSEIDIENIEVGEWEIDVGVGGVNNTNGGDTSLSLPTQTFTVDGGGYGGYWSTEAPSNGGSGGGGIWGSNGGTGIEGQGHNGGAGNYDNAGGGGGGAGDNGFSGSSTEKGLGGCGVQSNIDGELKWYAAGGSGAASNVSQNGIGGKGQAGVQGSCTSGVDGTGSGGGSGYNAGRGGSGICILRFGINQEEPHDSYIELSTPLATMDFALYSDNSTETRYVDNPMADTAQVFMYTKPTGIWEYCTIDHIGTPQEYKVDMGPNFNKTIQSHLELNNGESYSGIDFNLPGFSPVGYTIVFHPAVK